MAKARPPKTGNPDKPAGTPTSNGKAVPELSAAPEKKRPNEIELVDKDIQDRLADLSKRRKRPVYPIFSDTSIQPSTVDDIFDDIRGKVKAGNERLDVLLESPGGDIHQAFNLALLIRRYATKELTYIIPRWAKSAATMLACSGDKILMGPIAELGPVDPQITQIIPFEKRIEEVSPLYIGGTLKLIRDEFNKGHESLARGLLERLQFPLTLGGFQRSLEIAKKYLEKLLTTRMFKDQKDSQAAKISKALVEDYEDHGFCIEIEEARRIGLRAEPLADQQFDIVWDIFKLNKRRAELEKQAEKRQMRRITKNFPIATDSESPHAKGASQ